MATMTLKATPCLLLLSLALVLAGCGTLADRREARETAQARPSASTTAPLPTPAAPATQPALANEPATASSLPAAAPTATVVSPAATMVAAPDLAGEALLSLLDQLGADLQSEDGGVEQDLP